MSFTHFLATRLGLFPRPASCNKTPAASRRLRPILEALEERWLPSTLTVITNADSGAGSLRAEISAAKNGDTIVFAPSLDGQTITLTSGELYIKKNLTIAGPGAGQLTVSGNHASRVFELAAKYQLSLSGLTISNGVGLDIAGGSHTGDGNGGAMDSYGTLTVSGCTLSNNSASSVGGAIHNYAGGTLTVTNSTLSNNAAGSWGGGINNDGTATVTGNTLSGNSAVFFGGGISSSGTMTVKGGALSGNKTTLNGENSGMGGGIYNAGQMTLSGCTLSANSAEYGGGIDDENTLTLSGCTLSANSAGDGGGIYADGPVTVSGSTLSQNVASHAGGGIYVNARASGTFAATVTVENSSSISGNTAPVGFGADVYNLNVLYLDSTSTIGILDGNPAVPI